MHEEQKGGGGREEDSFMTRLLWMQVSGNFNKERSHGILLSIGQVFRD